MAKIEMKGLDKYTRAISRLANLNLRDEVCGKAVHAGAGVAADAIRQALEALPTDERYGLPFRPTIGPSAKQKQGLSRSLGISHMRSDDGLLNVKVGFSGYNGIKTKRWPKGQPNAMVARSVERGTTYMRSNPFVKRAMRTNKKAVIYAMSESVDESMAKKM